MTSPGSEAQSMIGSAISIPACNPRKIQQEIQYMRIAQVSPLYESVPPRLYGGTERVVSYLTEELVQAGHEVVLFASGDSKTSAELVSVCGSSLRLEPRCTDPVAFICS